MFYPLMFSLTLEVGARGSFAKAHIDLLTANHQLGTSSIPRSVILPTFELNVR